MPVDSSSVRRMFAKAPGAIQAEAKRINAKSANDMANHLRRIVPKRTGNLLSTVDVTERGDGEFTVSFGGPKTERKIGKRTYASAVRVGSGEKTKGISRKVGGHSVVWNYANLIEFGTKRVKKDPSFVPARRRATKLHRRRMASGLNKVARSLQA